MTNSDRALQQQLATAAQHARAQLRRAGGRRAAWRGVGRALVLMLIGPVLLVLAQLIRYASGAEGGLGPTIWLMVITFVVPLGYLLATFLFRRPDVDRAAALHAIDRQLATGDRLVTADALLSRAERSGFEQAAIEDACDVADRAAAEQLTFEADETRVSWAGKIAFPASLALLAIGLWLSALAIVTPAQQPIEEVAMAGDIDTPAVQVAQPDVEPPTQQPEVESDESAPKADNRREGVRTSAAPSDEIPDNAEEASGALGSGQASESEQSSSPSNARGAPSSQGQPSKPGDAPTRKSRKPKSRTPDQQQEERPESKSTDPAGSTAGQGSSRGSNKNPAVSDWSSRDQITTPDDDQVDEHDDVEDEEEEQDSRGGVQPNLRDRRPPVNRDLRIGFGNQKNPDANGRGGPSAQKKSRGVASLVLGAPIADRVKGQPNPGKTKVTQQRIQPEFEPTDPSVAQMREPRSGEVGQIFRPEMSPWIQAIVREYFLRTRPVIREGSAEPPTSGQ